VVTRWLIASSQEAISDGLGVFDSYRNALACLLLA